MFRQQVLRSANGRCDHYGFHFYGYCCNIFPGSGVATRLVSRFCEHHFPSCDANSWGDLAGSLAVVLAQGRRLWGQSEGVLRYICQVDFNAPGSRDSVKLAVMANALSNIVKSLGPHTCIMFCYMATCPKEDSNEDPMDDEVRIRDVMAKAGFKSSLPIRMSFE